MKISLTRPLPLAAGHLPSGPPQQLVETTRDETFAELLRLTAKLFAVPIALIAVLKADSVQVGNAYGLDVAPDPPKPGDLLGSLALLPQQGCVWENLHAAPCELLNPDFVHQLRLGFYASATLRTREGQLLGALCLLDYQPRSFHALEAVVLAQLATLVLSLLDLRLLLLQQPTSSQPLWRGVYSRIKALTHRLKTLAALARWEERAGSATSPTYQNALYEEILHLLGGLTAHSRVFQP